MVQSGSGGDTNRERLSQTGGSIGMELEFVAR
jgi:hypothetical protein